MNETDISFLRRQAELCIALSRATFDLTVAGRLRAMAEDLRTKAVGSCEDEFEHDAAAHTLGRNALVRRRHGPRLNSAVRL